MLDNMYALTHPSKGNYGAAVGGDFFAAGDDAYSHIPCKYVRAF
jgi:hypothetical protein